MKKIKIGLLGAWEEEHARRYAELIATNGQCAFPKKGWKRSEYPGCSLEVVWDEDSEKCTQLARELNCRKTESPDEILQDPNIDAVIICAATVQHGEFITRAAAAGKHVFVEKAAFASLEDAYRARAAIKCSGVQFMIGSPLKKPRNRYPLQVAASGKLGTITEVRFRMYSNLALKDTPSSVFDREKAGGGVLIDLGHHGMRIISEALGAPVRASAKVGYVSEYAKKYGVEDTAIAVYEFAGGAIGVVEVGWTSVNDAKELDIYGTGGRIHVDNDTVSCSYEGGNMLEVPEEEMPEVVDLPLREWIENIQMDKTDGTIIDQAVLWTEMLAAAYRAKDGGGAVIWPRPAQGKVCLY